MTFLYFAYGSNMLTQRIRINCPSVRRKCIAELKKFKFSYAGFASSWKGATANIVESETDSVWGVVWEIPKEYEAILDKQEKGYKSITVTAKSKEYGEVKCKSYQKLHDTYFELPSMIYKTVIIEGAKEHKVPLPYIQLLESFKDNGYEGLVDIPVEIDICKHVQE